MRAPKTWFTSWVKSVRRRLTWILSADVRPSSCMLLRAILNFLASSRSSNLDFVSSFFSSGDSGQINSLKYSLVFASLHKMVLTSSTLAFCSLGLSLSASESFYEQVKSSSTHMRSQIEYLAFQFGLRPNFLIFNDSYLSSTRAPLQFIWSSPSA